MFVCLPVLLPELRQASRQKSIDFKIAVQHVSRIPVLSQVEESAHRFLTPCSESTPPARDSHEWATNNRCPHRIKVVAVQVVGQNAAIAVLGATRRFFEPQGKDVCEGTLPKDNVLVILLVDGLGSLGVQRDQVEAISSPLFNQQEGVLVRVARPLQPTHPHSFHVNTTTTLQKGNEESGIGT